MLALLQLWWPVLVLVHLPLFANVIAVTLFKRIAHTHDWELADDLPQTAGDWLRDRSVAHGLRVIVTDDGSNSDAFHPNHRVIHLSEATHFKADAVFWSIAAHELGHARFHAEHRLLGTLSIVAMWLKNVFLMLGASIAIGNVLYARPRGLELAFAFLVGSLVLRVIELLEEAYASWIAYRELQQSAHLSAIHLRVVRRTLLAALGTYVSTVMAGLVLLSQWSIVERITGDGRLDELGELGIFGWVVVTVICVIGIVYALLHVLFVRGRARMHRKLEDPAAVENLFGLIWRLLLLILLVLVWDLQASAAWAWCVILAVVAAQRLIVSLLMVPFMIPMGLIVTAIHKLSGPGHHASDEFAASRNAGRPLILDGKQAMIEMLDHNVSHPSLALRVFDVSKLFYLPLIVAIGGGLIT